MDGLSFSVLLSVYIKENPSYLDCALVSICDEQELLPSQVVLVQDGPLTDELLSVVAKWKARLGEQLTIVDLKNNVGLAAALNEGLKHCRYELVARMDTDDVSLPSRFRKQAMYMVKNPNIAVCSGQIEEWSLDLSHRMFIRKLPVNHKEIVGFAKVRCPISHPAVMFRKTAVLNSGGYPLMYPEDYPLWGKMLSLGYEFANLPDIILRMRVGGALVERRGLEFLRGEIRVLIIFMVLAS